MRHLLSLAVTILCFAACCLAPNSSNAQRAPRWVRYGHVGGVTAVRFSPDGKYIASAGSDDDRVLLWDVATKKVVKKLDFGVHSHSSYPHKSRVLRFSHDGSYLFGVNDSNVVSWSVESGHRNFIVKDSNVIIDVLPSRTGDSVCWVNLSGTVTLYAVERGMIYARHPSLFSDLEWSTYKKDQVSVSDDLRFISFTPRYDDTARLFRLESGVQIFSIRRVMLESALLSPSGKWLFIVGHDTSLLYSTDSEKITATYRMDGPAVRFGDGEDSVVLVSNNIRWLNLRTGGVRRMDTNFFPSDYGYEVDYSQDFRSAAVGWSKVYPTTPGAFFAGKVLLYDQNKQVTEFTANNSRATAGWSPTDLKLVAYGGSGDVIRFDAQSSDILARNDYQSGVFYLSGFSIDCAGDSIYLTVGFDDESMSNDFVGKFDAGTLALGRKLKEHFNMGPPFYRVFPTISDYCGTDSILYEFRRDTLVASKVGGKEIRRQRIPHSDSVINYGITPDRRYLYLRKTTGSIEFRSFPSLDSAFTLRRDGAALESAVFSHSGDYALTTASDTLITLWAIPSGIPVDTFSHSERVTLSGFSFDDRYFAATSGSDVMVWDAPAAMSVRQSARAFATPTLTNSPNPVIDHTAISFFSSRNEIVSLQILDVLGREVYADDRHFAAGDQSWMLDAADLNRLGSGVFIYRISTTAMTASGRMVVH